MGHLDGTWFKAAWQIERLDSGCAVECVTRLANFGASLAAAGCACASFALGLHAGREEVLSTCYDVWRPGCGRAAPGMGER